MDEGRKRVIGIMAAISASRNVQTADDLFGGPQGSPRTDKLIAASMQWAEKIMAKIEGQGWTLTDVVDALGDTVAVAERHCKSLASKRTEERFARLPMRAW